MMAASKNPPRGSLHYRAKFNESEVRMILELIEHREKLKAECLELTNRKLADKFEVHPRTIEKIAQGRSWTHV